MSARASLQLKLMTMLGKLLLLSGLCRLFAACQLRHVSFAPDVHTVGAGKPFFCPPSGRCRQVLSVKSKLWEFPFMHVQAPWLQRLCIG